METIQLKPRKALNEAFLKVKLSRAEIEGFKTNLITLLDRTNDTESEEFHKNLVSDFLKDTYYKQDHFINTKGRNDLVIHNGNSAKSSVGVIIEAKKPTNKAEMITTQKLNAKAFQELVLYYLRERITYKNLEVKHLVATNINEWFIFDATLFESLFAQNKNFVKQFNDFEEGRLADTKTNFFYKQIAEPFIESLTEEITFTYFNLQDFQEPLRNPDKADDHLLIALFKLLSPEHLLKLPFINDSNSLDKRFYSELLHIVGLTETKDGGKKLIERNKEGERHTGSVLEDAIIQLDSLDKLSRLTKPSQFGSNTQERLFNVAIELSIIWINRILFLKLLEAQLITYHKGDKSYAFLHSDRIKNYDDLNSLFFQVLAREHDERNKDVKKEFEKIPYLNSSLFEPTELEQITLFISGLKGDKTVPIFSQTVLKDQLGKKQTGDLNTLQYLFAFLDAYDFGAEAGEEIREDNKTLINASVLGLIFEKINGYKDGSFFTPGFITMYMCRETIRKAVLQKFNEYCLKQGWQEDKMSRIEDIEELVPQKISRKTANEIVNSIKICDPAVGSGHFLVSALNEIIALKSEMKILLDKNGKLLKDTSIRVVNDALYIIDAEADEEHYYIAPAPRSEKSAKHFLDGDSLKNKTQFVSERQRVQETLFHEKQTIIENCLFGVDINPNSVKICRLRLWIELLKNAYYTSESNFTALETLPNIDINIKCGNSLVSRFAIETNIKQALKKSKWTIDSYRTAVATYRNAESKEQKRDMERLIADIKSDCRSEISKNDPKLAKKRRLEGELFNLMNQTSVFGETEKEKKEKNKKAEQLTQEIRKLEDEIENIKGNKIFDNAFEWRFEFPEVLNEEGDFVGFDVVIGNPPYVDYREIDKAQISHLQYFKTLEESPRPNLYQFFIELGYMVMAKNAHFCYINPNQFLSIDAGYGIRRFIVENTIIQSIDDVSKIKVFDEAATYTVVWSFKKEKNGNYPVRISKCILVEDIGKETLLVRKNDIIANGKYLIIANINQIIIRKIELNKVKLGTLCDMIWGTSQSGYGKKKILAKHHKQLDEKEKINYAPIIQTRDIKKYVIDWKQEYIPCEIFSSNAIAKFEIKEKIVIARMTLRLQAAIDQKQYFVGKSTVVFNLNKRINLYFLLALLNSKIINFWYVNYFENTHLSGGYIRYDIPYLKKIPLIIPADDLQNKVVKLVKQILAKKEKNEDTTSLESAIDQLVYELYELTEEEIKVVEGNL
ncbi:MAG: type II restriction endonuclease [Cytophagales bacterium]|nr:MAG: type II restriction endonuclease [Cytophagales bacterium]TAF59689.1 MAG: type II restriction endonuclease [Cytophagales bacterium]